jgi:predicted PurR-regulated permease PerM
LLPRPLVHLLNRPEPDAAKADGIAEPFATRGYPDLMVLPAHDGGVNESTSASRSLPPWTNRLLLRVSALLIGLYLVRGLAHDLRSLAVTLLVSLFLSFAIEPAVNLLARRGFRRGVATALVMAGVVLAIVAFVAVMTTLVATQFRDLIDDAPGYVEDATEWINSTFDANVSSDQLVDRIRDVQPDEVASQTLRVTTTVLSGLLTTLTILLFTFYLVADGPRLRRVVCSLLPAERQQDVLAVWEVAITKTGGYLSSRAALAVLSALFHGIVFTAVGVPSAVALAVWVGLVSQFLPVVGTYLAGVLPVFVALLDRPISAVWVVVVVVVYQQVENYLFAPRITARTMEIHPAVAFGSVIAGAAILGTAGAILALPAAASIQAVLGSYVHRHEVIDSPLTRVSQPGPTRRTRLRRGDDRAAESVSPPGLGESAPVGSSGDVE